MAIVTDRPAATMLPDRRTTRRPVTPANRDPWDLYTNPRGVAGKVIWGPQQVTA